MGADASQPGHAVALPGWRERFDERLRAWRNRRLAQPGFQDWVSRLPLVRRVARRHARRLFDLCTGFVHSQTLCACVRLRLFEQLRDGPLELAAICARLGLAPAPARHLLEAAQALGLLERRGAEAWGLGICGAALLGNPAVAHMIEHHALLYDDLRDPVALLRGGEAAVPAQGGAGAGGRLASLWPYARNARAAQLPGEQIGAYTALMAATQPLVAADVLAAYPFARHRRLLDVGGGNGAFLIAAAARAPRLQLMLFDLPAVAAQARERLAAAGLAGRATTYGGDFTRDELPAGADLITLVRVLHDHDDLSVRPLLRAARRALAPGGRLLIAEPMAAVPGSWPAIEAYFSMYLLAMGQGRPRRREEVQALLREAGFVGVRSLPTARPWQCALVCATAARP